ncbi:MAG: Tetratricopeptide repeat protein [Nitrospira sp.]|nr:MAG: Tetratricopeptide repeat protein [Nitrospira sp.]
MRRCLVLVTVLVVPLLVQRHGLSFAQLPDEPISTPPVLESPGPDSTLTVDPNPAPQALQQNELPLAERTEPERDNAVFMLSELRKQVMAFPTSAEDRLRLAQGLYRVGDFDAALDECRMALKLQPNHTGALLQLGILLMAKQEGHGAATAFMEALLIDPELTHAHYSLGGVQYSLGNIKAAMQSYRRALELQPHFPDAQYRLALLLKLTNRHQDAAQFMEEAAIGGVPQAQFFSGNAYKNGQGVEKHLGRAIFWWAMAAESGHQPAVETLGKLRRQALSTARTDRRRADALEGFQSYRTLLWEKFPDYSRPGDSDTLGTLLLKDNRADAAVSTLLQESYALSDVALAELVRLYETGWDQRLAPFDKNILGCLETVAADGFAPAKTALARIYGQGLGVTPDRAKAKAALKGLTKQDTQALLDELGLR